MPPNKEDDAKLFSIGQYVIFFWSNENESKISGTDLNKIMDVISDNHADICDEWKDFFTTDTVNFYC